MNKINRRFLHYETRAKFEEDLDKIPYDAIVFIDEGRTIYTHGEEYCNVDLSEYLTAHDIEQEYAKKTDIPHIPTNISAFTNDTGYLVDQNLSSYINDVELDNVNKLIKFKHGNSTICTISTTDFIKDGMVNTVNIDGNNLVVTFNTDAGKQPISIKLSDIFNPGNYYTKDQVEGTFAKKVDIPQQLDLAPYLKKADAATLYAEKNDVPNVPTNVSAFTNDAGYLTEHQDLSNYALKTDIPEGADLSEYAKKTDIPDLSDYLKKDDDIIGVDTEARALAQEAKDAADAAQETAESKQNKLTAGNGLIINNNVISIRDLANGGDSQEALIANVENAMKSLQRALIGMFVRREEVYKDVDDWGDDITKLIDVKIGSPYFYVIFKTLCAENVPQHEGGDTWTVSENICELDDKTLILN